MTDDIPTQGDAPGATITIASGSTYEAVAEFLDLATGSEPIVILPASLRRDDSLASAVRSAFRNSGAASRLLLPPNPVAAMIDRRMSWKELKVQAPDRPAMTIGLPARLAGPEAVWTVTNVDAVGGSGPYVLDLIARYAHPRTRLRLLASRRRSDAVVDVNLAVRPAGCVVGRTMVDAVVVGVTHDPIAAELFALALADEGLAPNRAVTGPWEDRVVQRATELELGVQIPQQLRVRLLPAGDSVARTSLVRILARIGVTLA